MRCMICRSNSVEESKNTYFAQLDNCYVIIENVPCIKCTQCGEVMYSASTLEKIDRILDTVQSYASKLLIMDYAKAA